MLYFLLTWFNWVSLPLAIIDIWQQYASFSALGEQYGFNYETDNYCLKPVSAME